MFSSNPEKIHTKKFPFLRLLRFFFTMNDANQKKKKESDARTKDLIARQRNERKLELNESCKMSNVLMKLTKTKKKKLVTRNRTTTTDKQNIKVHTFEI